MTTTYFTWPSMHWTFYWNGHHQYVHLLPCLRLSVGWKAVDYITVRNIRRTGTRYVVTLGFQWLKLDLMVQKVVEVVWAKDISVGQ